MNAILSCLHCGHRTAHTVLKKGFEKDSVELEPGYTFDIDFSIWFTQCRNCGRHALFSALDDLEAETTSLYPAERLISDKVPKSISNAYKEATKVKKISAYAFVILIRRALEITCKEEKAQGRNLALKIKDLGAKGIVPPKLTDMADLIRLIGNSSVHESDVKIDQRDIEILEDFFVAIIDYVYGIHEKIEMLKGKLNKPT